MQNEEFCEKIGQISAKIAIIDCKIEKHKANIGRFNDEYTEKELAELYKQRMLLKFEAKKLWNEQKDSIYPWV